jgi:hypothetical protein
LEKRTTKEVNNKMVSLTRKLIGAVFAGLALAAVLFLAASATVAAVPTLPAVTPAACAAVGFTCAVGATLADDLKEAQAQETAPAAKT